MVAILRVGVISREEAVGIWKPDVRFEVEVRESIHLYRGLLKMK
jgi:hypothetical protein